MFSLPFLKTPEAARSLGVSYHRLIGLLRFAKIAPPARDGSGDYVWTPDDLERARHALRGSLAQEVPGVSR